MFERGPLKPKSLDTSRELPLMLAQSARIDQARNELREDSIPTSHRLIVGDSRRIGAEKIGPVELAVTSPPYWTIVDYGNPGQIGFGQSLSDYIASLEAVWTTCHRVLRDGCRLVVNIGDQYVRAKKGTPYQIVPLHALVVNSITHLRGSDFLYLGSIVWRKVSTTHTSGGATVMGSYPFPRAVYPCFENEFVAIFRKEGIAPRPDPRFKEDARLSLDEWRDLTQGVWTFPGARMDENPAAFPDAIPERLIRMFTFPGETVFDPFVGSGTTMKAAASLGRNSVGVELGFKTATGRSFESVVEDRVLGAGPLGPYVGKATFRCAQGARAPDSPQTSHS